MCCLSGKKKFTNLFCRSRVDVERGRFIKIAVNHEVVQLLSDDGSCADNYYPDKDFDECMYSKIYQLSMEAVGCTVPWILDTDHICTDPEKSKRAFEVYQQHRRNQEDICKRSCLFTNMYFGPPVTGFQNNETSHVGRAIFYFRRDIKATTEYYLYSLLSMVAEIGGYVGLLMGVSLFKIAHANNVVIDWYFQRYYQVAPKDVNLFEKRYQYSEDQAMRKWTNANPIVFTK
jgi:hypothetical protein